jgi:hypothetical protein
MGPVDKKAFLPVNQAGRNPSWPQECIVLGLGGTPPGLKTVQSWGWEEPRTGLKTVQYWGQRCNRDKTRPYQVFICIVSEFEYPKIPDLCCLTFLRQYTRKILSLESETCILYRLRGLIPPKTSLIHRDFSSVPFSGYCPHPPGGAGCQFFCKKRGGTWVPPPYWVLTGRFSFRSMWKETLLINEVNLPLWPEGNPSGQQCICTLLIGRFSFQSTRYMYLINRKETLPINEVHLPY